MKRIIPSLRLKTGIFLTTPAAVVSYIFKYCYLLNSLHIEILLLLIHSILFGC